MLDTGALGWSLHGAGPDFIVRQVAELGDVFEVPIDRFHVAPGKGGAQVGLEGSMVQP